ncbi:Serine/threonine-protein kinase tor1 [Balamuthia mandrillaris]
MDRESWNDTLSALLNEIKRTYPKEHKASKELKAYVATQSREMTREMFATLMADLTKRHIFDLVSSPLTVDKITGIVAINQLIDLELQDESSQTGKLSGYLSYGLLSSDPAIMSMAAKALGRLAQMRGTITAEFVAFEMERALEWLSETRNESRTRNAAVLVLKELASNAPTLFYVYIGTFFDLIWAALRDETEIVREAARKALRAALRVIAERSERLRLQWYHKVYEEAQAGLKVNNFASIHGSLITLGELLKNTGEFMHSRFAEVCEMILSYRTHRDKLVRKTVIELMPRLAKFAPKEFKLNYLNKCMVSLLSSLKKEKGSERAAAFLSLGKIAMAVGGSTNPYLDSILQNIKTALKGPIVKNKFYCVEALTCISMLARSVGASLESHMPELLELMFAGGLNETLTTSLTILSSCIPSLLPSIQEKLLDHLSMVLSGKPFLHPGNRFLNKSAPPPNATLSMYYTSEGGKPTPDTIRLALTTLGSFNFDESLLTEFVREVVVGFLDDDDPAIRTAAAETCSSLVVRSNRNAPTRGHLSNVIGEVLEKMLVIGISDPDPTIRTTVLSCLDSRFDHHLAQAENLRSLFIALNDEVFVIRELAIKTIGRLTTRNPAYVLPSLRKTLIQLLTELDFSGDSRNKEESARLMGHLIRSSQPLIKPYVEPIVDAFLPKLTDKNARVVSCVLATLGDLATVGGEEMVPYIHKILPLIIETLQDQSSVVKREVALSTLGKLAESTGYVIEPFLKYPKLLDIVLNTIKTEQAPSIRKEMMKVLGILGALDPYKYKLHLLNARAQSIAKSSIKDADGARAEEPDVSEISPSSEDYYLTVSITALVRILRDASLSRHHKTAVTAIMAIFQALNLKCVPYLPQVMPPFLQVMRSHESNFQEFLFKNLGTLVSIIKQHVRDYLDEIFLLVKEFWNTPLITQIIKLVEHISMALNDEFKTFLPELIPQMLSVLHKDRSPQRGPALTVLRALEVFGTNLDEYLHLIIPAIVNLFEQVDVRMEVRMLAIQTLGRLCNTLNFNDYASRIIHPLARVLDGPFAELKVEAMQTLCALVSQLGSDYMIFIPMVEKVLLRHKIVYEEYNQLVETIQKNDASLLSGDGDMDSENITFVGRKFGFKKTTKTSSKADNVGMEMMTVDKLPVNERSLSKAWDTSQCSIKNDWKEWFRRFSVELIKQSPSPALRSCHSMAQVFHPLAMELFNVSFVSCWTELHEQYQNQLIDSLETALNADSIPPEILQSLLNLAEFMEHDDKRLPIDIKTLGGFAEKCAAYAKALHYKEIEFQASPATTCEALISINNQLDLPEAANGILVYARQNDIELKESWYEKLQRWDAAKEVYDKKLKQQPQNMEFMLGRMRCLHALAEWEELTEVSQEAWQRADRRGRLIIAPLAAGAAWNLGLWDIMKDYINEMPHHTVDGRFFRAVLNLHGNNFEEARKYIELTRQLLDTELRALVGESYNRAYKVVVKTQQLSEMEEIIEYKQNPARQPVIRKLWTERLRGCQKNVDVWQDILAVRSMVLSPHEDTENWLKFASLCRAEVKAGEHGQGREVSRMRLSHKTLINLLGYDPSTVGATDFVPSAHPKVVFAYLKHQWDSGDQRSAFKYLRNFIKSASIQNDRQLLARCHLTLGIWQKQFNDRDTLNEKTIPYVLQAFKAATEFDEGWYKAWHLWALSNFEVISHFEKQGEKAESHRIKDSLVPAVHGFFRSIALAGPGHTLQDTLRLLSLWFKYGSKKPVERALMEGFNTVSIDTWLQVVPQLIARIHTPVEPVARMIRELLTKVGRHHPQALVYPLSVATKSPAVARVKAANIILDEMRQHSANLVDAALLVSRELIRVAILWHELWFEGLEEASRLYFGNDDVEGMFEKLRPLHEMLEEGPQTSKEVSFQQAYGRDLQQALEFCQKYSRSGKIADLNQAWDLYYHVFRRIDKQLRQMSSLELQYVSPNLLKAHDLELAVPGTYEANQQEVIRIASFAPTLSVIPSKQRPRKLSMYGSDGKEYTFLLKGHEDLRQDERVMQLFGLLNTLLATDSKTAHRHLSIQQYAIIPLSPNSGLIGWVPDHDTLHALIRDYRDSRKILLNYEHRLMIDFASSGLDHLSLIQKVEVFDYALENTNGNDLDKVLWLKSNNSEIWLEKRTNYTRSLAVMSMVGYILGLGDRHPSNLMMDRHTGKITHIDFGDCFEVAMQREKYPEKIPFRLTRMLINAMEVSGIEGNFRFTCESVMRVLRENKESVMAVLEAFVYDPLINWRLLQPTGSSSSGAHIKSARPTMEEYIGSETSSRGILTRSMEGDGSYDSSLSIPSGGTYNSKSIRSRIGINHEDLAAAGNEEGMDERALRVIDRVSAKLRGRDFSPRESLDVHSQVQRLIEQATSHENLCQCYIGWCPFW